MFQEELGAPVEADTLVPVGMLETQMPVGLFEVESEPVVAPAVDRVITSK